MPRVGKRELMVMAGMRIAERGLERLTIQAVADDVGMTYSAVSKAFPGGREALRAAVVDRAARCKNPFICGQLRAIRGDG